MSLYNKATCIRTRMMSFILQIVNIKESDLDFMVNAMMSIIIYFGHHLNCLSVKKILYI